MRNFLLLQFVLFITISLHSQDAIRYQAVAYDDAGQAITSQLISLEFNILQAAIDGTVVYSEVHSLETEDDGSFVALIGRGNSAGDSFSDLVWQNNRHFLQVAMDAAGNGNFVIIGTSEFHSVPYALHANVALRGPRGLQGVRGMQGPIGEEGPQGERGPLGLDALITGPVGDQGPQGNKGDQGPQGLPGSPGQDGDPNGPKGMTGDAGPQGDQGKNGIEGPKGPNGRQGLIGPQGPQGLVGEVGPRGEQGEQGERGGTEGEPGPPGPPGIVPTVEPSRGPQGPPGLSCWDLNGNGVGDFSEDQNGDGVYNAADCQGPPGVPGPTGWKGATGPTGSPKEVLLSAPPDTLLHRIYLDDGTNRVDSLPGFRYCDGVNWIDLY